MRDGDTVFAGRKGSDLGGAARFTAIAQLCLVIWAAGTARAESVVNYTVQLGGTNHAASWKAGTRVMYSPGSSDDDQTYAPGSVINWAVAVAAGGAHVQPGHPADGFLTYGAANLVFDLEIREGDATGPLAGTVRFFSSINDGTGTDPTANAAFALGYNVRGAGPGALFEPAARGGPALGVMTYPTSHDFPLADNPWVAPGQLIGMGAGYRQWDASPGSPDYTAPGVGLAVLPNGQPGLGAGPVAEGQIDTSAMSPGTYVLRVIGSQKGTNVLRGDVDLTQVTPAGAYAVKANRVVSDEIRFVILPEPGAILLLALATLGLVGRARSRRFPPQAG